MASWTKHSTHTEFMSYCRSCRWSAMTPEDQERVREQRRQEWAGAASRTGNS